MSLLDRIAWINGLPWKPVSTVGLAISSALAAYIAYCAWLGDGWVPLVDDANVAVHEAGHPLVGIFSARLGVYGGTLAQLLFPAVCMVEFWRRREALLGEDVLLANGLRVVAWVGIAAALGFVVYRWWDSRTNQPG